MAPSRTAVPVSSLRHTCAPASRVWPWHRRTAPVTARQRRRGGRTTLCRSWCQSGRCKRRSGCLKGDRWPASTGSAVFLLTSACGTLNRWNQAWPLAGRLASGERPAALAPRSAGPARCLLACARQVAPWGAASRRPLPVLATHAPCVGGPLALVWAPTMSTRALLQCHQGARVTVRVPAETLCASSVAAPAGEAGCRRPGAARGISLPQLG
jgi:hypothetical protein